MSADHLRDDLRDESPWQANSSGIALKTTNSLGDCPEDMSINWALLWRQPNSLGDCPEDCKLNTPQALINFLTFSRNMRKCKLVCASQIQCLVAPLSFAHNTCSLAALMKTADNLSSLFFEYFSDICWCIPCTNNTEMFLNCLIMVH